MHYPKFKIRTIYPWSEDPTYEILLFERKGKGWSALRQPDGSPARFNGIPGSIEEAEEIMKYRTVIPYPTKETQNDDQDDRE